MSVKRGRSIIRWIVLWLVLSCLFVFVSNIYMHLATYQSDQFERTAFKLKEYHDCTIVEDGQFARHTEEDPIVLTYFSSDPSKKISKICIDFGRPLTSYVWVYLYYPDETGDYPLDQMRYERLVPGLVEHVIDIPTGKYPKIMLQFESSMYIKEVYAGEPEGRILYTDKVWQYRIW